MSDEYKPRLSFEITEEQQARANQLLSTYGLRRTVMGVILDDLLDLIEEHGQIVVGILLERSTKPREIIPSLAQAEKRAK